MQSGRDAATSYYTAGLDAFKPVTDLVNGTGTAGYNAYADATGANGAGGLDRAKALFTSSPGYTEGLNMTLDQNDRRAAARGMLGSGNTIADTTKLATDYANQKYGDYVSRLAPFTAVPGQAAGVASGVAGINTGLGNTINQSLTGEADLWNKAQMGIGNANASAELANLNASGNIVNGLMQGAKLASSALPALTSIFSDEDLKDDIEQVGELFDGQPIYRYHYKNDPLRMHIGLIAQEVEDVAPDAVSEFMGFKAVDYGKATDFAAALHGFAEAA